MRLRSFCGLAAASGLAAAFLLAARAPVSGQAAEAVVTVDARDAGAGTPLPCRLTLLGPGGAPAAARAAEAPGMAVRPGVVYAGTGRARFALPAGEYTLHATRGPEYGLVTRRLRLRAGEARSLRLALRREVDTAGYVAADTHIHTLTYSGHGDCTLEERMATIAGEGIELAIATDHNHHTDYAPAALRTGTRGFFTPVPGNEVTTPAGHFNAFPVAPGSPVPEHRTTDWSVLLPAVRAVPGVRVVVLNHPSDDHGGFIPTDPRRFHPASGESRDGRPWSFDGMEVVTSAALQSDLMKPYRDWFALLNRGMRLVGVGSSDSHDVNRFLLGQGRTYIASSAASPDRIDIREACDRFLEGRVLVSMGLLAEAWVEGRGVGETVSPRGPEVEVRVRVQGPRWIDADRLDLYYNGRKWLSRPLADGAGRVVKTDTVLRLPRPAQDGSLVAIATGPGVDAPYWPIPRPYQPSRPDWEPRVIGSTSPIYVDADGDGTYRSPRETARRALDAAGGTDPARLLEALRPYDEATAVQAASLLRERGVDLDAPAFRRAVDAAAPAVRHGFVAYRRLAAP